jgi:hypothetical protein
MNKAISIFVVFTFAIVSISCQTGSQTSSGADSPTGAYQRLYAAVKKKDIEAIRAVLSKKTLEFAKMASSQQNKPVEKVLENGFTATTFSESLPEIRDERIAGDMGAVEVYNSKERNWEDLPFIREDGAWKLAIGDIFADTWKSPGPGRAQKEREAANAVSGNNMVPLDPNINGNFNSAPRTKPIVPKPALNMNK